MGAYYNEFDPFAAQWLRNLIAAGHIAPGDVDERSIVEVTPDDVRGYAQCHWFAGIGVWSHALRLAGWPDERPVWTASLPCQPFSVAGKQQGHADERHLAPVWLRLVGECRPAICLGEQVGAAVGMGWLDALCIRLEQLGYAAGAVDFPACSVGAPHIRQRVYWVADAGRSSVWSERSAMAGAARGMPSEGLQRERFRSDLGNGGDTLAVAHAEHAERRAQHGPGQDGRDGQDGGRAQAHGESGTCSEVRGMADADRWRLGERSELDGDEARPELEASQRDDASGRSANFMADSAPGGLGIDRSAPGQRGHAAFGEPVGGVGHAEDIGQSGSVGGEDQRSERGFGESPSIARAGPLGGFWSDAVWLPCTDGKARPTQPGVEPLVDGAAQRVGRLRAYGNCIVAPQAQAFIECVMDCSP